MPFSLTRNSSTEEDEEQVDDHIAPVTRLLHQCAHDEDHALNLRGEGGAGKQGGDIIVQQRANNEDHALHLQSRRGTKVGLSV